MNRRAVLAIVGTGMLSVAVGCLGSLDNAGSSEDEEYEVDITVQNERETVDFDAEQEDLIKIKATYDGDDQGTFALSSPDSTENDLYDLPFTGTREEEFTAEETGTYTAVADADHDGDGQIELMIWVE